MDAFKFHNPTKLIFGQNQVTQLQTELPENTNKVLLVYGGEASSVTACMMQLWRN